MRQSIPLSRAAHAALALLFLAAALPSQAAVGIRVKNGRVYESNGNELVLRGISHAHTWYTSQTSSFANIKAAGANSIRVVLSNGVRWNINNASDVANVVNLCKTNKLICVLEVHDTTGYGEQSGAATLSQAVDYWISIQSVLTGQENYVVIDIGNEPYGNVNTAGWITDTANAIRRLRSAGFQHLIMVDAPGWGQDADLTMQNNASATYSADTTGNTLLSVHMYSTYSTSTKVTSYLSTYLSKGLPIAVGEFGNYDSYGDVDEDTIMSYCQTNKIGWLGWSWSGNSSDVANLDMVTNFNPSQRTSWGNRIITGANGLSTTSREATIYSGGGGGGGNPPTCTATPSTPGSVTASAQSNSTIRVSWSSVTPPINCSVTYNVLRGSTTVVSGLTSTSFTDSGLAAGTSYSYTVVAVDSAGSSSASSAASAMTPSDADTQAPSTPSGLSVSNLGTTSVTLAWNASTDNKGVSGYTIYSSGSVVGTSTSTYAQVGNLSPGTTYAFSVKAYDAAGNVSAMSNGISVTTSTVGGGGGGGPDLTPPSVPSNLTWNASGMTVTLSWGASTDNVGVAGYQLYFGSFFLGTFSDTSLALIGFKTGTPYVFTVKAVDAAGNVSVASNATTVLLQPPPDTTPPSAPSNLTATSIGSTTVSLRWSASTDDVGVVVYQIYAGTALVGTIPSSTSGTASKLTPGTTYGFTVKAVDAAGNVSQASSSITVTTSGSAVDVVSPSTPIGLSAASTGPTVRTLEDAGGGGGDSSSPLWVNIGGSATGSFVADTGFSGGSTYTSSAMVTSPSSVVSAAVFQSERYGDFTYTLGGYVPGSSWIVTLYFAETYLTAAGQRSFDVSINGAKVLTGFDIYAAAGGANIGVAKSFSVSADSGGRFGIGFATGSVEKPKVNAISITRDPVPVGGGSGSFNP